MAQRHGAGGRIMTHSPPDDNPHRLPWKAVPAYSSYGVFVENCDKDVVLPLGNPDFASMVVRACNSHADLIAALEEMLKVTSGTPCDDTEDARTSARAALANAKGEMK